MDQGARRFQCTVTKMKNREAAFLPIGIGAGLAAGVGFGLFTDNLALGISLGVALGCGLGVALMGLAKASRKSDGPDASRDEPPVE